MAADGEGVAAGVWGWGVGGDCATGITSVNISVIVVIVYVVFVIVDVVASSILLAQPYLMLVTNNILIPHLII